MPTLFEEIFKRLHDADEQFAGLEIWIEGLEEQIKTLESDNREKSLKLENVLDRLGDAEEYILALEHRINALEAKIEGV